MTVLSEIRSHPDVVDYFKKLPFHNKPIEKPKIKRLKNIKQLSIIKTNQVFRGYAMSYKVEITEKKRSTLSIRSK